MSAAEHLARARHAFATLARVDAKGRTPADENEALQDALAACRAGDPETAATIIEALLAAASGGPAPVGDEDEAPPPANPGAAARARIGEGLGRALGQASGFYPPR